MKILIDNIKVSAKVRKRLGDAANSPYHNSKISIGVTQNFTGNSASYQAILLGNMIPTSNWVQDTVSGEFIVPESGTYFISGSVSLNAAGQTWSGGDYFQSYIVVNDETRLLGRLAMNDSRNSTSHTHSKQSSVSGTLQLNKGDVLIFTARSNVAATHSLFQANGTHTWLTMGKLF